MLKIGVDVSISEILDVLDFGLMGAFEARNDRWSLTGYGDIGGFGLGSDITWQLSAGASYEFTKSVSGVFGYRIFYADYDKSSFLYDMKSEGLYAGVGIRF